MTLPYVVALCPTYRRPDCLQNALACFQAQDYPESRRMLIALDDSGEITPCAGPDWRVESREKRFESLPQKYNWMASGSRYADIFFVWEDDDVFGPQHIVSHVNAYLVAGALGKAAWCKSEFIWSTHPNSAGQWPIKENAGGRFHSSVSFTGEMFGAVNGWPVVESLDFDARFMSAMNSVSRPLLPVCGDPQYIFRWSDSGGYHGQGLGDGFWERTPAITKPEVRTDIHPKFDDVTKRLYAKVFGKDVS